jgi:hypothetical protein
MTLHEPRGRGRERALDASRARQAVEIVADTVQFLSGSRDDHDGDD